MNSFFSYSLLICLCLRWAAKCLRWLKLSYLKETVNNKNDQITTKDKYNSKSFFCAKSLVLTSGLLTCLQLLQVVATNLHIATVLLQTSGKRSGICITSLGLILVVIGLGNLLLLNWSRRRPAEHSCNTCTQGVANSRTNSNTGSGGSHVGEKARAPLLLGLWVGCRGSRRVVGPFWCCSSVSRSTLRSDRG